MPDTKTVSFYTLGCRLNQAETALIEESFIQEGYRVVPFSQPADLCIINSCTVTEKGDADCRKTVRRFKRNNPEGHVAVVGCYSQVAADEVSRIPGVNLVVGTREKMSLASQIETLDLNRTRPLILKNSLKKQDSFSIDITSADQSNVRANLKIQDGCDFFCSYCVIPYARGRSHSRRLDNLLEEARHLVDYGHRELVLTGINVGTYHYRGKTLLHVIRELEKIPGLDRIRISSIENTTFTKEFLQYMADSDKLCSFLHLPLQSGSDDILIRMNRKYTTRQFEAVLEQAVNIVPGIAIGTDVIVGFPGETDEHFEETFRFLEKFPFAYFHIFSYSDRSLAKASKFNNKVDAKTIKQRSKILRGLGQHKKNAFYEKQIGKTVDVLFEQKKKNGWTGHNENYILVQAESSENLKNKILPVTINRIEDQTAIGTLV